MFVLMRIKCQHFKLNNHWSPPIFIFNWGKTFHKNNDEQDFVADPKPPIGRMLSRSQITALPKPRENNNFIPNVSHIKGDWYDCHVLYENHKKISYNFKKLMSWMKDVSLGEINKINIIVIKAFVDQIIVDILDGMLVHSIDEGCSILFWMHLKANGWWETLFDFLRSIFWDSGCILIMCNARTARVQEKNYELCIRDQRLSNNFFFKEAYQNIHDCEYHKMLLMMCKLLFPTIFSSRNHLIHLPSRMLLATLIHLWTLNDWMFCSIK